MNKWKLAEEMWRILSEDIPSERMVVVEDEIIPEILDAIAEAESRVDALQNRIGQLNVRKALFESQCRSLRDLLKEWLAATGQHKLVMPAATVSLLPGKSSLRVINIDLLPSEYIRMEKKVDLALLREAAKNQTEVPGAVLEVSENILRIRRN
jgi:hypothetical protein